MKYAIFLTQKGQINLQNYSKVACLNMGRKNSADTTDKCGTCREQKLSVFQRSASSHIYHDHSLKSSSKEMHLKYVCVGGSIFVCSGFFNFLGNDIISVHLLCVFTGHNTNDFKLLEEQVKD